MWLNDSPDGDTLDIELNTIKNIVTTCSCILNINKL